MPKDTDRCDEVREQIETEEQELCELQKRTRIKKLALKRMRRNLCSLERLHIEDTQRERSSYARTQGNTK